MMIEPVAITDDSPTSRWHLTTAQIAQFDQQGFLLLPNRLPCALLKLLQQTADSIQTNTHVALKTNSNSSDIVFTHTFFQPFLNRVLHYHLHAGQDSLVVLGCPQLLALAHSLCGKNFVPTVDMMIFKHRRNDAKIPWHQDLIYQSNRYRVATAGIYLDDSNSGDGALQVIPATQAQKQDICAIVEDPPNNIVEIAVKAGDILLHNPMMVHCSDNMNTQNKRRTLYYEFRPMSHVINKPTWPDKLIKRRLALLAKSLDMYAKSFPQADQYRWHNDNKSQVINDAQAFKSLYQDPVPFDTANFCTKHFKK